MLGFALLSPTYLAEAANALNEVNNPDMNVLKYQNILLIVERRLQST